MTNTLKKNERQELLDKLEEKEATITALKEKLAVHETQIDAVRLSKQIVYQYRCLTAMLKEVTQVVSVIEKIAEDYDINLPKGKTTVHIADKVVPGVDPIVTLLYTSKKMGFVVKYWPESLDRDQITALVDHVNKGEWLPYDEHIPFEPKPASEYYLYLKEF